LANGRHVNIFVVGGGAASIKRYRVSRLALSLFCFAGFLLVSGISLSLKLGLDATRLHRRASQLEKENGVLRRKLLDLSLLVSDLKTSLEENIQFEKQARTLAGLDAISDDVRLMGVGGPDIGVPDDLSVLDEATSASARDYWNRLDEMQRQVQLEKRSYSEILDRMTSQRDLLEHTPSIRPVEDAFVSSGFGRREDPFTGSVSFHQGIDLCTTCGTPVLATANGKVVFSGPDGDYGLTLQIDHGRGVETRYSHNERLLVRAGQVVRRGQTIAQVGTSGRTTGPHVHYEIHVGGRPVDPTQYILPDDVIVD
jgi:murein DD-endopeptidase MepM/ murein hydrolase activator NlpD